MNRNDQNVSHNIVKESITYSVSIDDEKDFLTYITRTSTVGVVNDYVISNEATIGQ